MRGLPIKNPMRIVELANQRKSVLVKFSKNIELRLPAAVIQNWQLRYLAGFIDSNRISEYRKEGEKISLADMQKHPRFNPEHTRIELMISDVLQLPIKIVSEEQLYEIFQNWDYNPSNVVGDIGENIEGHDLNFRYKLEGKN